MLPANVELVRWALSPDGHHLAYSGESADGATHLYHRQLDQRDAVRMPGTEGADVLTFSPNGEWIAFTTGNELKRISLAGGSAVPVSTLPEGPYGVSCTAWTEDDTIWCGSIGLPLHRVAASGGVLQPIEGALGWLPRPLPGGRGVLYSGGRTPSDSEDIYGVDRGFWAYIPQSGEHHQIMAEFWVTGPASNLTFVSTGHLLYVSPWEPNASSPSPGGSSLWAAPFDLERLEIVGEPVRVRDGVDFFVVGREGSLVYRPPPPLPQQALVWVGRGGREEPLAIRPRRGYRTPRLSSDGTRVAIGVLDRQSTWADQIWVHDLDRGADLMIAGDGTLTPQQYPFWTTDGGLLFTRGTSFDTVREMTMLVAADGSNQPEMLFVDLEGFVPVDWTADGNLLMVENAKGYLDSDIGIMTN